MSRCLALRRSLTVRSALCTLLLFAVACGGDDDPFEGLDTAGATVIPTATPFAVRPEPIIVTADGDDPAADATYVVEAGDTLSEIAQRFDSTVDAILAANDLQDATLIFVGQELLIPGSATPIASGTAGTGSTGEVYVVEAGDTAFDIALRFNVTVADLAAANGLTEAELANLQVGDELLLPRPR